MRKSENMGDRMIEFKDKGKISKATAKRLPLYYRNLILLQRDGVTRIKSKEFAEMVQVPSTTIRRDFSSFGELGKSGYGYDVNYLVDVFKDILNTQVEKKIALVGVGNLGKALIRNNFRKNSNLNIVCAFDRNPDVIGQQEGHCTVYSMDKFNEMVRNEGISVAISTVPSESSQEAIDAIVDSGLTAILNFSPERVTVPKNVHIQYIDLTTELQTLIYFDDNFQNSFV